MDSTPRRSLFVRMATLTLALGTLGGLVVYSSMSVGCSRSPSSSSPTIAKDPAVAPAPTANPDDSIDEGRSNKFGIHFPASKAGPVFRGDKEPQQPPQPAQQAVPRQQQNAGAP